jgi:hypothetical protein
MRFDAVLAPAMRSTPSNLPGAGTRTIAAPAAREG